MNKAFENFFQWKNQPSTDTPLGARLLNMINNVINTIDDRVVAMDTNKLSVEVANTMVKDVSLDDATGVITITKLNGSTVTIDTKLEKIAVNIGWNAQTQKLILYLDDGTTMELDLSTLITQYEFTDTDTIAFTLGADGKVSAVVKAGSITEDKLRPDYLADVRVQVAEATAQADMIKYGFEAGANWSNSPDSPHYQIKGVKGINYSQTNTTKWVTKAVQKALNIVIDAKLEVDGDWRAKTTAAVNKFKKMNGWKQNGVLGKKALKALLKYLK